MNFKHIEYINGKAHCYKTERPEYLNRELEYGKSLEDFHIRLQAWKDSAEIFEFAENEQEKVEESLRIKLGLTTTLGLIFKQKASEGIDITSFCEVKQIPIGGFAVDCRDGKIEAWNMRGEACLLRAFFVEPAQEESQVDLAKEMQDMFERGKDWTDVLQNFTLTRKQK